MKKHKLILFFAATTLLVALSSRAQESEGKPAEEEGEYEHADEGEQGDAGIDPNEEDLFPPVNQEIESPFQIKTGLEPTFLNALQRVSDLAQNSLTETNESKRFPLQWRAYESYRNFFSPRTLKTELDLLPQDTLTLNDLKIEHPSQKEEFYSGRIHLLKELVSFWNHSTHRLQNDWLRDERIFRERFTNIFPWKRELIEEAYFFLPTPAGLELFEFLADRFMENGDLSLAIELLEDAKTYSAAFGLLSDQKKIMYLSKLASLSLRMGWKNKHIALREEIERMIENGRDSNVSDLTVRDVLNNLQTLEEGLSRSQRPLQVQVQEGTITIPDTRNRLIYVEEGAFINNETHKETLAWTYVPNDPNTQFISSPLILRDKVYAVSENKNDRQIFLVILNRYTGDLVNVVFLGCLYAVKQKIFFSDPETSYSASFNVSDDLISLTITTKTSVDNPLVILFDLGFGKEHRKVTENWTFDMRSSGNIIKVTTTSETTVGETEEKPKPQFNDYKTINVGPKGCGCGCGSISWNGSDQELGKWKQTHTLSLFSMLILLYLIMLPTRIFVRYDNKSKALIPQPSSAS